MASSKLDPAEPIEFVTGTPAYVIGQLFKTGRCHWVQRDEHDHAEVYAELFEQGVRFMVATDRYAAKGGCVNAHGHPVKPYDSQFFEARVRVRNRLRQIITDAMEGIPGWGSFG
jgi:hypothetical protein